MGAAAHIQGKPAGPTYLRRQLEKTALYQVMQHHLLTFEQQWTDEASGGTLPKFVLDELHGFMGCGILGRGFAHLYCESCGEHHVVAFSCKARAACPSCVGRRMSAGAANLVDHVLPDVPIRQFVMTMPFPLRFPLAFDGELLRLLAAATAGGSPAGPASKRQPIRIVLDPDERFVSKGALCGQSHGFNLRGATRVAANDKAGRERLCRYILRLPLANDRLSILDDGNVRLDFKRPWSNGLAGKRWSPAPQPPPHPALSRTSPSEDPSTSGGQSCCAGCSGSRPYARSAGAAAAGT